MKWFNKNKSRYIDLSIVSAFNYTKGSRRSESQIGFDIVIIEPKLILYLGSKQVQETCLWADEAEEVYKILNETL